MASITISQVKVSLMLFLSRVSILTRDIDIAILFVCLSVRPSVRPSHAGILWKRLNILL